MPNIANLGTNIAEGASVGMSYGTNASQIAHQKASADKLLSEAKTVDERFKREVIKTELWEVLRPMIARVGQSVEGWNKIFDEMDAEGISNFLYFLNTPSKYIREQLGNFFKEKYKGFEESEAGSWILEALGDSVRVGKETFNEAKGLFK